MKITGKRDGFLTRDISYFENIYDALHEDGDAELFLVKLEPKPVLEQVNKDLDNLSKEKKSYNKKARQKTLNKINDAENKIKKTHELKVNLTELEKNIQMASIYRVHY